MAPTAAAWNKVAEDYRDKYLVKKEKENPSKATGVPILQMNSTVDTLVDSFLEALDVPVVQPVAWMPEVPESHPIRQQGAHVLLWDAPTWAQFRTICRLDKAKFETEGTPESEFTSAEGLLHWWMLLVSACNKEAKLLFCKEVSKAFENVLEQANELRKRYDSPKHQYIMLSIVNAASTFNGLREEADSRDTKKLDTTEGSTSSEESLKSEDAPSLKQDDLPQKN